MADQKWIASATVISHSVCKSSIIVQQRTHTASPRYSAQRPVGRGYAFQSAGTSSKSHRQRCRASRHAPAEAVRTRAQVPSLRAVSKAKCAGTCIEGGIACLGTQVLDPDEPLAKVTRLGAHACRGHAPQGTISPSWELSARQRASKHAPEEVICIKVQVPRPRGVGKGYTTLKHALREATDQSATLLSEESLCHASEHTPAEAMCLGAQFLHLGVVCGITCARTHAGRGHVPQNTSSLSKSRQRR